MSAGEDPRSGPGKLRLEMGRGHDAEERSGGGGRRGPLERPRREGDRHGPDLQALDQASKLTSTVVKYPAEFEEKIKSGMGRYVSSKFEAIEMASMASSEAKWEKEMISAMDG